MDARGLLTLVAVVGCSDDEPASRLDWQPCSGDELHDCAQLDVPLDYGDPTAGTVPTWALRSLAEP